MDVNLTVLYLEGFKDLWEKHLKMKGKLGKGKETLSHWMQTILDTNVALKGLTVNQQILAAIKFGVS